MSQVVHRDARANLSRDGDGRRLAHQLHSSINNWKPSRPQPSLLLFYHIHRTGVPRNWGKTVSLHFYGRHMNRYNVYDFELGRRTPVDVAADNAT